MKRIIVCIYLLSMSFSFGQKIGHSQFSTKQPLHILDSHLDDISFALGMRVLVSDYEGPLIRLRRDSDNTEMDFYSGDNDIVNIDAINTWGGTADLHVVTWYDQSGLSRNAVQPIDNLQPRFIADTALPYFLGNGTSHRLDINTSIQLLTNAGADGTVLGIIAATRKNQNSFGVLTGTNRWSAHMNWGNGNLYFDPGPCCNGPRNYNNVAGENKWSQYTFLRGSSTVSVRQEGIIKFSGNHTRGRCTLNNNFGILYANGYNAGYSNNKFNEFIMYPNTLSDTILSEIEENQTTFWNL